MSRKTRRIDLGGRSRPHPAKPAPVRAHGSQQSVMSGVTNAELGAHRPHDHGEARVMDMADLGEQVMLDLEVETPEVPGQQAVPWCEVDRALNLMHSPGARHLIGSRQRLR